MNTDRQFYLPCHALILFIGLFVAPLLGESIEEKAAKTVIPKIEFKDASLKEACEIISKLSAIIIDCNVPEGWGGRITFSDSDISAKDAIRYVASLGRSKVKYGKERVEITNEN